MPATMISWPSISSVILAAWAVTCGASPAAARWKGCAERIGAQEFLLPLEKFGAGDVGVREQQFGAGRLHLVAEEVEHRGLAAVTQGEFVLGEAEDAVDAGQGGARAGRGCRGRRP